MLDWSARLKEVCIKPGVFDTDIKVSSEAMQEQSPEGEGGGGGRHGVAGAGGIGLTRAAPKCLGHGIGS